MKSDVVIVGGGPAGSAAAMFLARQGVQALIIEKETFPRYHIGESLTGAGGKALRDLELDADMYRRGYPRKQGAKVYGQSKRGTWFVPVTGRDENWNLFEWDTWQVRRSEFDKVMLEEAIRRGAGFQQGKALRPVLAEDGAVRGVTVQMPGGGIETIESEMLLDCTGQATWLANLGGFTGPKYLGAYDKQIAVFSQVVGALREHGETREADPNNTLLFYQQKHHWAWFIPLDEEVVSVGVVIPGAYFLDKRESRRDFFERELRELHPELARRIPQPIVLAEDVHVIPNYSYQVKRFTGRGFMCLGDAHRFVDPIFSFGVTLALREAQFAAPVIRDYLDGKGRDHPRPFADHELSLEKGIDVLEDMIDCFWEHPLAFGAFVQTRYSDLITDLFAGRVFEHQPSAGVMATRKMLDRERQREQSYESEDLYSIPIGSRFHPERAPIWEADSEIESTEDWMGPR
jgi:1H-pyrrole-2-carbonyl-[peptidyl-carrier protein] brominase